MQMHAGRGHDLMQMQGQQRSGAQSSRLRSMQPSYVSHWRHDARWVSRMIAQSDG